MQPTEHFDFAPMTRWQFLVCPWCFAFFVVFGLAVPLLPGERQPADVALERRLAITSVLLFGTLTWVSWRIVKQLPDAAVSIDSQGIWKSAYPRELTFVAWNDVVRLRQRAYFRRLELLSGSGTVLLKLEYQLHDFERLCQIVVERSALLSR